MYKVRLINMPFFALSLPSIALMQLKSVAEEMLGDQVSVEVSYLNHEFAKYIGVELYDAAVSSGDGQMTGIGDWLFRQAAFPEMEDNSDRYFKRYYNHNDDRTNDIKRLVLQIRQGLENHFDQMIQEYKLDQVDMLGFTSMFDQTVSSLALARMVKKRNPNVMIIMGGANCEFPMGQELVKNMPQLDFVFSGPALKSFPQFLQYLIAGQPNKCHSIPGVFSKKNCALTPLGCGGGIGEELPINEDVKLDYESYLQTVNDNFKGKVSPILLFETSRGCWWGEKSHCTFCGLNGTSMAYRSMDSGKAITLINDLFKYADRCKTIEAVDNILPRHYVKDVFSKVKAPQGMTIIYEVKADLRAEDLEVLSNAGVRAIQPGIESLATSTLKLMGKGVSAFSNISFLKNCIPYNIFPIWNLLIGFPGEEEDVFKKYVGDLPLLTHLTPPNAVLPVRFDRYSPYYVKAKEYNLELEPLDYYQLIYPLRKEQLANLAYFFYDSNMLAPYFLAMARWLGKLRQKVANWRDRWSEDNGRNRPRLFLKANSPQPVVYDSRPDNPVEHRLSELSHKILDNLNKARKLEDLAAMLRFSPDTKVDSEIAELQGRGLIFQEGERYLSLVSESKRS